MRVFVTGGTGFVGRALTRALLEAGHRVTILTRGKSTLEVAGGPDMVQGDPGEEGPWQEAAAAHDAVVNLAGASIFRRWNREAKERILQSRVRTTRNLVSALGRAGEGKVLLSGSAVGFYGFRGDEELTEQDAGGEDFLAGICRQWEEEALRARDYGARVAICRLGIVLAPGGGALAEMLPLFRKGLGSPLGSGRQWFSWVHRDDLVRSLLFLLQHNDLQGVFNCTAPQPVTNKSLTKALARALGRPAFLPPVPRFLLRLIKGELGTVLLEGQRVLPARLTEAGFVFRHPEIEGALRDILGRWGR